MGDQMSKAPFTRGMLTCVVLLGAAMPEKAQALQATIPDSAPSTTPAPAAACASVIPYSIGDKVKGFELAGRFSLGALSKLKGLPNITLRGGKEVVQTAYAGMTQQAMATVFDAYACRISEYLKAKGDPDADKKVSAVNDAIADLQGEMGAIQKVAAPGAPIADFLDLKNDYKTRVRGAEDPVLDRAVVNAALADIDSEKLFINVTLKQYWGGLDIPGAIALKGCGGVVKAAISDGGSSLQRSLADAKFVLANYLDPATKLKIALGRLMNDIAAQPTISPIADATFKGCTTEIAAQVAPPAPPAPPAVVAPGVTSGPPISISVQNNPLTPTM